MVDAFVLGHSLERHGSRYDCVLLVTEEVILSPIADLLYLFWKVHPIKHVPVGKQGM